MKQFQLFCHPNCIPTASRVPSGHRTHPMNSIPCSPIRHPMARPENVPTRVPKTDGTNGTLVPCRPVSRWDHPAGRPRRRWDRGRGTFVGCCGDAIWDAMGCCLIPGVAVGDQVWLNTKNLRVQAVGSKKLLPRYVGPFPVKEKIGEVAYRLQLLNTMKMHDVFSCILIETILQQRTCCSTPTTNCD